jgi:hypothetical protein
MRKFRILLVEELVLSDSGEFTIEASTPAEAAAALIEARYAGLDNDDDTVRLPDGQTQHIEPEDVVRSSIFCMLLDDDGYEIGEIEISPRPTEGVPRRDVQKALQHNPPILRSSA